MEEILSNQSGKKVILLGNDAVARGALEAGVQFVATYPGTPASEIGNTFYRIAQKAKVHFEFSTNEKLAMEAGVGASFAGLKTLVAMKNFGLNVAIEALLPFVYTGVKGPTVVMVSDDPSCYSSAQTEENTRAFSYLARIPTLEPADVAECKEFTKLAFEISEKFKVPVLLRLTTRVSHQKMPIVLGQVTTNTSLVKGKFVKDARQFVTMPPRVLEMKEELLQKNKEIRKFFEKSKINKFEKAAPSGAGIIVSGVAYLYVREALAQLNLALPVLKIGSFYPFPKQTAQKFIKTLKKVLVVEELDPYLAKEVKEAAQETKCKARIFSKEWLPETGELNTDIVALAVAKLAGRRYQLPSIKHQIPDLKRRPQLCPGCPYWLVFAGVKKAVNEKEVVFGGDIGCYMLAGGAPHFLQDYLSCMGSSIGIAHGIKKATGQKLISFIGDGTFFHAGIPALINTVYNGSNPLIIILDNRTTAMTGHQPNPSVPGSNISSSVAIEDVARGCGVKHLKVIDPVMQDEFIKTIREFITKPEVSVIIARRPCIFVKPKDEQKN
ncbi:MAG: indolepyruvate ferredoxin oxidoreductase subunit alpha [Candidatus Nealsonbacteria bacterium]|nr:indolepyruvate ferredoxin oxidoreductase subunit alpha [Candidatus Nealsonbacteria bacterium]